jgi:hypothetical protein
MNVMSLNSNPNRAVLFPTIASINKQNDIDARTCGAGVNLAQLGCKCNSKSFIVQMKYPFVSKQLQTWRMRHSYRIHPKEHHTTMCGLQNSVMHMSWGARWPLRLICFTVAPYILGP